MKKIIIILSSLIILNINASNYLLTLEDKHYKGYVQVKPVNENSGNSQEHEVDNIINESLSFYRVYNNNPNIIYSSRVNNFTVTEYPYPSQGLSGDGYTEVIIEENNIITLRAKSSGSYGGSNTYNGYHVDNFSKTITSFEILHNDMIADSAIFIHDNDGVFFNIKGNSIVTGEYIKLKLNFE